LIKQWCVEVQNPQKRDVNLSSAVLAALTASVGLGTVGLTLTGGTSWASTEDLDNPLPISESTPTPKSQETLELDSPLEPQAVFPAVLGLNSDQENSGDVRDISIRDINVQDDIRPIVESSSRSAPNESLSLESLGTISFGQPLPNGSLTSGSPNQTSTQPDQTSTQATNSVILNRISPEPEADSQTPNLAPSPLPSPIQLPPIPEKVAQESPPVTEETDPSIPSSVPSESSPSELDPGNGEGVENAIPTTIPANPPDRGGEEVRVLVSEIQVSGVEGHPEEETLRRVVFQAVEVQAGQPTTRSSLQNDLDAIFVTGYFSNVRFLPEDTPLGVRVTFIVDPNPTFTAVETEGIRVLPPEVVTETFGEQYGRILNLQNLQDGVQEINEWYQENGYVLAQVVDASQISSDGVVTLVVAEGEIALVDVRFLSETGEEVDEDGNPIKGKTKPYIITREFSLKPGDIFNRNQAETDLQRVFGLGLFEDVRLSLDPAPEDPRQVVVVANVIEGSTGSIGAGAGLSSDTGLFGSISYQQQNLRGRNYILGTELTLGEDAFLFDIGFTNPWIKGDPYRTSYTVNAFRRRSISLVFDEGDRDVDLPNGDTPRIVRTGGGVRFNRPLSRDVYNPSVWNASLGLQYQRVGIQDEDGDSSTQDELGNDLTFSGDDVDDLITLGFGLSRDLRNNRAQPTGGSLARVNLDQSLPFGSGSILMNRIRGSYSYYIPMRFIRFKEGCRKPDPSPSDCPQTLAFNVQAGTVFGDLPPYEAFILGGTNSIRGYEEGAVGAGRSFLQATAEYRFPLFSVIGGALFADVGTDLGTGDDVPGEPAEVREKPGGGFGVGLGVRVRSPIGAIRVDYGLNDQGDTRFHFGIGERF
jgi:outer membrane protein insertion porin family